jgi:hypothetical protein
MGDSEIEYQTSSHYKPLDPFSQFPSLPWFVETD